MTLTREQIINFLYKSKPVIDFYRSAITIGFWPDIPGYKVEDIVWYLNVAEIIEVEEVDELLIKNKEMLGRYIADVYQNRVNPWRVTPGFLCGLALVVIFSDKFSESLLVDNGWEKELASIVMASVRKINSNSV